MIKIMHIITGLGSGGAENMLHKLVKYSDKEKFYHEVISLIDEGVIGEKLIAEGIKVHSLNLNRQNLVASLIKARKICKEFDIINTWLYHADVFGFITSKILLKKKLIWNVRHSNLARNVNKSKTLMIVKLNSFLSMFVDIITYNSNKALENHMKIGFNKNNSIIVPNGFELENFKFDMHNRVEIRKQLGVDNSRKLIITVGRWHIQKDYYTLLKALNELKKINNNFVMIMCGTNLDYQNKELSDLINEYNLKNNIKLLGRRDDIPALLSAADIYVSSSLGESFSNAIGEAMACELPCIVTNVGDSKLIVGSTGRVIEPENYKELFGAILEYMEDTSLRDKGKRSRQRVKENYEISIVTKLFESIFERFYKVN